MQRVQPTEKQLSFMDWEFGVFFHFGIRSFFPGHKDWDGKPMPASAFQPDSLDCDAWLKTAKEAGARYAILVCKHHDGFALWPSRYTAYSVASSPWKNGQGDVVAEFTAACRKYGVKVGLYYSPAQWGDDVSFADAKNYDDYFIAQISELLENYGEIDYIWFDGCGSEGHAYDKARIVAAIRRLQPGIRIFNMWDPDTRWVGNEDGYAPSPNPCTVSQVDFSMMTKDREDLDRRRFLPAECDFQMRDTWFDCEDNEDKVKSVRELMGIWELSVGRGANFLINIGPDCHGRLPEKDAQTLLAFGEELRRVYGAPLDGFSVMAQGNTAGAWEIHADETALVNRVSVREDLSEGESVMRFHLEARLARGSWLRLYEGTTIGHRAICVFPTVRTDALRLVVDEADGPCRLLEMTAHLA